MLACGIISLSYNIEWIIETVNSIPSDQAVTGVRLKSWDVSNLG